MWQRNARRQVKRRGAAEQSEEDHTTARTRRRIVGEKRATYRPSPENRRPSENRVRKMGLTGVVPTAGDISVIEGRPA